MTDIRACAELLIETVPPLMRGLFGSMRQAKGDEEEQVSIGQVRMLEILHAAPRALGELASLHHVTPSTMSRTVDVLVRNGLVERRASEHDRRQIILTLTPAGEAARAATHQRMHDILTQELTRLLTQLDD